MKKFLAVIFVLLAALVGGASWLIFTASGNATIKNYLETKLNAELPVPVQIAQFSISPMQIKMLIGKDSRIDVHGAFDIWKQAMDLQYDIDIKNLANLKPLTQQDLRGPFATHGTIKGDKKKLLIEGVSDVAGSDTKYRVELRDFEPFLVTADIKKAQLAKILYMVMQPHYADGVIDAKVRLTDLKNLDGTVDAWVREGRTDAKVMQEMFGMDRGLITFTLTDHTKLSGGLVVSDAHLASNVADVQLKGAKYNIKTKHLDAHYNVKIDDLAKLKFLTKQQLRGHIATKGHAVGDEKRLVIEGTTDLADSASTYHVELAHYQPKLVQADIKKAQLGKLLYMLDQPHYADALIDSHIKLTSLAPLSGTIATDITQGRTDAKVLKKEFDLAGAHITFQAKQRSTIQKGVVLSDIDLLSSVANLHTKGARFDMAGANLAADYTLDIPDLGKLYFITKQKMRCKLQVTGKVTKDKDLRVTAHSKTLGGTFDAELLNNDLRADIKQIEVVQLTDMLYQPRIFDSKMDAKLRYNILTKKGTLAAKAINGRILPNQMTFLLSQMAKFDITREIYKLTTIHSRINDKKILSDLDMESRLTHISAKNALVDLEKEYVDAKLRIDIKKRPLYVKLKGNLKSPKVSLDAQGLLKQKVKEKLQKQLDKKLKDKVPDQVKGLLNLF